MVGRVTLAGSAICPLVDLGGPAGVGPGGKVTVDGGREAMESARHRTEVGWVHGEREGKHGLPCWPAGALDQQCRGCIPAISMAGGG